MYCCVDLGAKEANIANLQGEKKTEQEKSQKIEEGKDNRIFLAKSVANVLNNGMHLHCTDAQVIYMYLIYMHTV